MTHQAKGRFEVKATRQPPFETSDGIVMARTHFDKQFEGDLIAESFVEMMSVGTPTPGSAAYVALEKVTGTLGGKSGCFAMAHLGLMTRGAPTLTITIVPDSGTGELVGLRGSFTIDIRGGQHFYTMEFSFADE